MWARPGLLILRYRQALFTKHQARLPMETDLPINQSPRSHQVHQPLRQRLKTKKEISIRTGSWGHTFILQPCSSLRSSSASLATANSLSMPQRSSPFLRLQFFQIEFFLSRED